MKEPIWRQLVELRERYQNKQQEHKEYKHKLKALEAFYQGQVQQQECYIEELRKHIQAAQSQAEQELKHDQEQLKQQIELNQQCLANEERRLESLAQHRRELGTQTEIVTFTECGVQITLQNKEIPSLEQDRKRLVQLELLQKHSLKKAERNISKKRVKYQLERIAGKQKLLEAKTNLQHLEAASLLSKDQLKQPTMDKMNTLQTSPNPKLTKWNKSFPPYSLPATKQSPSVRLLARRHSDSNDLVSRLYPQYVPVYSDFLKRKNLATSPQTKKWHSSTQESHSVGSSPKQGLSNSRQQAFKRGSETVSPAWGQNHKKQKAVGYENVSKPEAITEPNESRNFTDKEHTQKDNMNDLHPEVQQVSSKVPENKHSSGCMLSETRILVPDLVDVETNRDKLLKVTNEDMRQDFSWKRMFMDVGDTSRVCKKPPCGRLSRAKRVCKECAMRTSSLSQCQHPIKGASSLVNLWEQVPHPDQTSKWHSDKILNAGITTAARDSLRDWSGTEETSDGESVYSVDSLSSAYATALKEQLLDEELEAHQGEWHDDCSGSDDSQMSQDSLVDTDTKLAAGMMNVSVLYNKVTGFNLANRGRSISLNSLADVKGQSDIFGMDSAESTASDEMPAEMYWNLPWTEGDETKAHQASEAQLDKNQGMGAVRLKRLNFYLSSNTELKTTGTDKNTRLENLEPNRNDMDSVIVTDGWSSCESSRGSNLKADSACDTCVSGISQEQDERIWIRPVLNFGPPHDCQQYDGTCNFPFVNLREDNAPCTEDKDNSLDQEKAHLISTFRTDRVTTSDPSCTEHPKVNVTEMVGNPKIETLHALARKTQDSNVPDQVFTTQQYPLLIQSKELGESFVTDSCLKLRSAGTDVVASRQNVSSEMEVANREQQITETEAMRTQSQGNQFDDETCHRRCDMRGSASKVNTTNFSSGFESLVISGTEQSTLQSESQTLSDFSCPPTISNSSGPYGLVCGPLEQVLDPSVEFGYIQKNGQVDTSLLTDSIILGNSLMQNETKPSLEFSAIQHKDSDSVLSALMKDGHSQTEQSNLNLERVRQTAKSFIMQGSLDTKCTVTKGKDSCDLLASSVRNIAVQKPKNHRDLLRNDGGYTSTEALLQAAANPEDSEGKINELRTTDDEPFISLQQSVVSNVVSNKKEEFLLRNKGHDKEATKISCNPDVEDCLHYPGNPCNGDSQDQQCENILSEETTELTSSTCGQSVPNFNTEEPQTNVGSRLCDRFNLDCNILTKLNSAYCTLPKKHNIPAESLSRDHLHQPFIQEPENINMLIKEESETSHGPNTERVSIKESMTYQLESTNTQRNRSRSKAEVNQSVHDHQKTDVNQNDVASDLQTVQFIKESNVREKRFRSDYVSATNFLDYEEIGIDNVSEAKLNKDNMVNGAVQSNLCYFGVSPPSDLIEDSVMMTDAGFLGEPRDCEVPVEKQVYSVGTSIDVQTTACEGGEVLFGNADDGQTRVICTEPIQRGGVASDCREQDNSKGNSPVNGAAEKFGSNPGTTDHYFQKTSLITRRSNVAKINGSARTTSVDLVNDSKACELFTLHKNRGECTAKIGKEGNKVLFFCSEDLEQLNENDSDEVRASQKATEIKEDRPSGRFNSLKYSSEQTCVTQCFTENEDVLGQTSKERSQLCDWSYRVTEACNSMARSSLAFHSEINASYDAGHTRKAVGPSQQENAVAAQNIGIESKSYLETEYNIKTSSNEIESKYDCELQLKTDLLMYPAKGNEMLTDTVQDVSRIILESNEEGDAMDLIQEKDVVVEFEDRANGGNAADISYGAVTLDNQLPFTVVDCTLGKCENNEPSSMPKPETAERMPKNSEPVKSLTESKISMETKNIAEQNGSALFIHNDNQETKLSACQLVDRSIPYLRTDNSSQQNCLHPLSPPTFANNDDPMGTNSKESATRNEQHIMCEENVLSFSRNKTEHLVSTKTSLVTNRTCSSNDQSFRFATCMAHGTEIRQTLPDRYSQDIPQDVVITSATGEVDCEIKEQDSADIFRSIKSAASCMNSFNEEEQSLSQEKALPVIENSDCKTLQEIDLFAMVSEGSEVCSAASLWDIDGHSFTNQQLQTTPECVQAELGNHAPVDFKALPVPPENNFVVDSVELSLTSSKAGSTADENLHLRRLDCELFCKHITQQQLAKSIAMTDRATCSKATPLRQNSGQGKLYEEPISTPKPIETIPETDTPQPRGISLVQQDISEVVESTQSCFISKDNLKEISGENTGASECQTDSTFSRKDECSGAGTILPSQGIVLKEVIGKHVMWYQLDTPAISNVSDFQIDEQADHSDQARPQKPITLDCRRQGEDSSVSLTDGDLTSELTEDSLNLLVAISEQPSKLVEKSAASYGKTAETAGCPQNGNDKNIPDSANKKSVQKEVNGSERYEEAQLQLQGVQRASKQEQLCSGGANKNHEVSAHVKDEKKSHSPTKVDFIPQHAPECSNKPSVQTRTQKVVEPATSECKSEMHHSHSHTNFCTSVYQKKQLTELQQTPNQFTPEHKLSFEAKLQTKDLNGAGVTPDVTETYNKHFFQESVDLSVIQIEQSEGSVRCKQIGKLGPQSRTSNKCTEMNQICHATDLLTLSDSPRSNCSVHSSVTEVSDGSGERFNTTTTNVLKKKSQRMRSKPIIDVTKDSSSSDEEVDIEFLSLKELRSRRCQRDNSKSQSCICKGKGSVNTIGAKLEEMRSPLLKQKQAAPVVHISSSNMDPPVQDSSGYSPTAALITNSFDAFNSSDAAVSTYREQVVEAGTGKDMHENLCQKLNLRSDLVGERVSLNPDSNMSAIVHSEVVSPCKQGIKQQSNKHQISATSYESHPGMFTEGKLKEQHLPEEMSFCKGKDLMHFASSDINPYVHQWQCNELHRANWKQCVFGSTSNVRNVQSQLSSPDRVMRCSSVDNGLNVQNSPFSSHLSCYVNERAISDTLSNVSDFQDETSEAASSDPSDLETFQRLCDQSIPASFFCSSQFPCPNCEIEDARSQVDEIVLLYPTESSVKSASDGSLEFTCNQATQTPGGVTQQRSIQQRKCTQTLTQTPKPQNPWSNLENLSAHLSQFLHSTTELLGNIRPNTNYLNEIISPSNQMPGASGTAKTADCCTQTAMDVAIQTETLSLSPEEDGLENARKEVLSSPEVNVIVRVIGSDVNMSQEHANVTLTLQEQQQSSGVSDLNTRHRQSQCSSLSTEGGKSSVRTSTPVSLDTQKLVSNSSQVCSISPGDSPVATASQESMLSDFTQCIKSVSSLESASEFSKLETYSPSVLEDRQKKSFSQGFQARQEAAFADIKPADLVDRASSPIQTLEAGSASWRSCNKSFQCPEGGEPHGLWHSDYWKRKPRSASWYGLNEKQQHEINFRQMESESEQRVETNSVSLVLFHEQNKFASNDLSSSTQWESTADSNDGVQSSSLSSSPSSESARACNAGPSRQWEKNAMTVGHSEQVPLCNSAQSKESESQLVLHSVQMLSTSNTEVRKLENSSAFSPAYHNPALSSCTPTLSKSDDTTILSRRIFHRSSSMPSVQQIPFSENGIDLQERESRTLQDQSPSQNDSINDCNSVSGTSIMSEKTIEFTTEDAQSLVSSECNTEMLLNENLSTSDCNGLPVSSSRTAGCRGPEDLPLHNKFCNWSGVHYRPLSTSSGISEVTRSRRQTKQKQTKGRMTEVADFQSELQDVRQKEIESLRQERAEIMSGMYLDFNQHQLTVELTEAKLNYGLGETDALLRVLQCGSADDINVSIRQKLYDSGIDDLITSRGRTAYRRSHVNVTDHPTDVTIESIHASCSPVESVSGNISHHISHTASSNYFKKYQDLATHTVASVKAEVMVASINNLSNLLHGKSAAGWRYHCTEKGVQIFYKKYASPTKHGFLGVGVIEKPLHCVWCTVKDHSKRQLYDSSVKTVKIHQQLGNGIELVYLVNDTSVCYLSQPRDFCCISVEAKEDQQYILAMQSIYEESMPRPVKDLVRGEMMPSGWILQPDTQNGKEVTRLIYLTQVDLGAPALPARLLGSVAKRQPLCIANLASLFSC
ncbi:hypothetical protein chiPu_0016853 [Chiloscyllium punctatum]|uniref:START domain-containing protein n=1 Tax=Chiloscyllium punctatum TaxID=137246 RepID=A0A401T6R3_CHIPU|nr:hypothetical protein [Chiloscyllium punctatum]